MPFTILWIIFQICYREIYIWKKTDFSKTQHTMFFSHFHFIKMFCYVILSCYFLTKNPCAFHSTSYASTHVISFKILPWSYLEIYFFLVFFVLLMLCCRRIVNVLAKNMFRLVLNIYNFITMFIFFYFEMKIK